MSREVQQIVIVGGGAAGWLTAGVIAAGYKNKESLEIRVTLIESPDVQTLGVGEGTWPSMRDTLRHMGISESDLVRECDASFKQGSKFVGWMTGEDNDRYYHPFMVPQGYGEANLVARWRAQYAGSRFAELVSCQPHLCEQGKAPKQMATPEFAAVANYAYHLDAGKFGQLLQKHCTENLGVVHLRDHVLGVNSSSNGDISSLQTAEHNNLKGDLFIDCSGFSSLLLGQHYKIPFISKKDILFNDTALVLQVPYENDNDPIASQTTSTAQTAGWIWDIGLPTRRGVGYVYSSAHVSDEDAEAALWQYVENIAGEHAVMAGSARKISMNPGHRATFWHRNCVAVGVSAGFIEPLEASALALIEMSAAMIRDDMPANRELMGIAATRFNERFRYRWERVIEFLKMHYVLTERRDSDFWIDNCREESIPERLRELLSLWRFRPPSRSDFYQIEEIFPAASFQYVLYGMGFTPDSRSTTMAPAAAATADRHIRENSELTRKMLAGLPSTRELINHVILHGMPAI